MDRGPIVVGWGSRCSSARFGRLAVSQVLGETAGVGRFPVKPVSSAAKIPAAGIDPWSFVYEHGSNLAAIVKRRDGDLLPSSSRGARYTERSWRSYSLTRAVRGSPDRRGLDSSRMSATNVVMTAEPLREVRDHFSDVVDRVERHHERVTVTRNGRPVAALISPADLA